MKEFIANLKLVWRFAKHQKKNIIKTTIWKIILMIISVVVPLISAKIIVNLTDNKIYQCLIFVVLMFVLENLRNFAIYFSNYFSQSVFRETMVLMQKSLGDAMLKLETKVIDDNGSGVFIQRLTNDVSLLSDEFSSINNYFGNIITNIGIYIAIFVINKWIFLYSILYTFLLYYIFKKRNYLYNEKSKVYKKESEITTGFISELVRGIRDIKMLNSEKNFLNKMEDNVVSLNNSAYDINTVQRNYTLISGFTYDFGDLILQFIIGLSILYEKLTIPNGIILFDYSGRVIDLGRTLDSFSKEIKDFNLASERVFSIIDGEDYKKEKFGSIHLNKVNGDFEFKNVSFAYDKNKVLRNLNLKINANETVAFVGKTGAGKTTIFSLLCKMYDNYDGEITIDNIDIKKLDKDSIRGNITIISQSPYIFHMSIKDNLKLVKGNLTKKEMIEACKAASLHDFIMTLPKKYDTIIGEGGVNLSGGQKQRLAIARALVQKTEIILFDEATSSLDNETQMHIQKAIENMKNEYTILIIAHRLSTIINADRILFLDNGKITASGTHKELLKNCPAYKNLYESEITKDS
jgi:ABC-type multidrug transport system fused ATPase/permease subunit